MTSFSSSPYSTGGGGFRFENKVGALYLASCLARRLAKGIQDPILSVHFQNKMAPVGLDDLGVFTTNSRVFFQLKKDLVFGKNKKFRKVLSDCWYASNRTDEKIDSRDNIIIGIGTYQRNIDKHLKNMLKWAKFSTRNM